MPDGRKKPKVEVALKRLRANREAMPWPERREIAAGLARVLTDGRLFEPALCLLKLLADDPQPEVRKEVAELLYVLPDDEFTKLAAHLSVDSSFFVQKAVERAMDRRRRGARASLRARRHLDQVEAMLETIERYHGKLAADRARKVADKQFELLVGETVHDIRNVLSPLQGSVSTLIAHVDSGKLNPKTCRENLARMGERLNYLERFVNDMREYSQTSPAQRHRERVSDVVGEAKALAQENMKLESPTIATVEIVVSVPENLSAEITRHQIVIALNHLIKNAAQSFETLHDAARPRRVEVNGEVLKGESLKLAVRDNGPGIHEDDVREYLRFIPGRTTKSYGTGFGLPTAHRCARAHGGAMSISSKLGEGTTVTIVIPLEIEDVEA
jgi:signal transduction histidine kinase